MLFYKPQAYNINHNNNSNEYSIILRLYAYRHNCIKYKTHQLCFGLYRFPFTVH